MTKSNTRVFVIIVIVAIILGGLVLLLKPDYRIDKILESNKNYYSEYKVVK